MNRYADRILGWEGPNPFSDSQARNFSDEKVSREFYPISSFWSLFNDQHEVLLGTRGCGKTFLLKMMRYSMLKKVNDPKAKELVELKAYIGLYVPMHLEFVTLFNGKNQSEIIQSTLFQVAFNCLLAEALLVEVESILEEENDIERVRKTAQIARKLDEVWFDVENSALYELHALRNKINKMFYNMDWENPRLENVPVIFKKQICSSLVSVKALIAQIFMWKEEPTWIVCIDEAEFLNENLQKIINSMFRSDTNRVALKVATLPFFHKTLETVDNRISVVNGNDFIYRVLDMSYDSIDFINLTNNLCKHRLNSRFDIEPCPSLECFLGVIGRDDQIDYFREDVGVERSERNYIEKRMIESFSQKRSTNAENYTNKRKTVYDKFAPIYFVREMYIKSKKGNSKPGWYAGSNMVRKLSQGNPRIYIQLMSELFETAKKRKLDPKHQSEVLLKFAEDYCSSTKALEMQGPIIHKNLDSIANQLKDKVHGQFLVSVGSAFHLKYRDENDFEHNQEWLKLAVAYSRIVVNEDMIINGIAMSDKFLLANAYAVAYWIPMRGDVPQKISLNGKIENKYSVRSSSRNGEGMVQLSLFEGDDLW